MTSPELKIVTRVEVQQAPTFNTVPNPNARDDLYEAVGYGCTLSRVTGQPFNSLYGATAFRLVGAGVTNSYMTMGGGVGAIRLGMEVGKTYTARGTINLAAPLGGTADATRARSIVVPLLVSGSFVDIISDPAPNTVGEHEVSVTFTIPAGTTEAHLRYYLGHTSGTAHWYNLRLSEGEETDFFDGSTIGGGSSASFSGTEYGWEKAPNASGSWRVDRTENVTIPEAHVEDITYDTRRTPYIEATIVAPIPDQQVLDMLDPRRSRDVILNFAIEHYTRGIGGELDQLVSIVPSGWSAGTAGKLWLRERTIDRRAGRMTLRAASGEVRFEDKTRIATTTLDTGAGDFTALLDFILEDIGEIRARGTLSENQSIPAGDRRLWLPGETASSVFEAEFAAYGLRMYCDDRGTFTVRFFDDPPGYGSGTVVLGPESIIEAAERIRREDGRDATIVKAQYINGSGTRVTAYQVYPASGVNRNGAAENIERPMPASNYAQLVTERAQRRGVGLTIEAALDFRAHPGRYIETSYGEGRVDRAQFRPLEGTMTLEITREA